MPQQNTSRRPGRNSSGWRDGFRGTRSNFPGAGCERGRLSISHFASVAIKCLREFRYLLIVRYVRKQRRRQHPKHQKCPNIYTLVDSALKSLLNHFRNVICKTFVSLIFYIRVQAGMLIVNV